MTDLRRAQEALARAEQATSEIERTVWLAKAADYSIADRAVLVGGAAVNLYTQQYQPTDIDMCAYLSRDDRDRLTLVGFVQTQGDHFKYEMPDGQIWLLEFPDTRVDGTTMQVRLNADEELTVISLESLILDRIAQATDGSTTNFDEAVRLGLAALHRADWREVERQIRDRNEMEPHIRIIPRYEAVMESVRRLAE